MDALIELPVNKWPELQLKLLKNWPRNIAGYYALKKNLEHPALRASFQLKAYCPYGDINNGFIAKGLRGTVSTFIMFTVSEDTSKLEEALVKTKVIDWSEGVFINMLSSKALQVLHNVKLEVGLDISNEGSVTMYYLDRTTEPFNDISLPEGTQMSPVKQGDISRVNDTWYHGGPSSYMYFSSLVSNGFSYGLYSHDSELLAWLFTNEYNFLRHLYCEVSHRRKGYAEYLMKYVINDQLRQGNDLYCFVEEGNSTPVNLMNKLGFGAKEKVFYTDVKKETQNS